VAGIALVALVALVAGQRFSRAPSAESQAPGAESPAPRAPDISNLTPEQRASRLYDRVMAAHEQGQEEVVQSFAPMAIAAYEMMGNLNLDQRYDVGRIAAVSGDTTLARAQADTILSKNPTHLLGLILASSAARMRKDQAAEREYQRRLVAAAPAERAKQLPEYTTHDNDITLALEQAKRTSP
jgi:hypothetical protein